MHASSSIDKIARCYKTIKPDNKKLKILILGGGPTGLFAGYKMLKRGNEITIFEKRKKYIRHNILSLHETNHLDTLSLIPSEIMDELKNDSSFSSITANIERKGRNEVKNILTEKPYLMASSRAYYLVLNELEYAYEKYFKLYGGRLIKPYEAESFSDIRVENHVLRYSENDIQSSIDMANYDIIFINDGANSFYRNIYFKNTSYTENIESNIMRVGLNPGGNAIRISDNFDDIKPLAYGLIFLYDIENKKEFRRKFHSDDKLKTKIDFNSVLKLENINTTFMSDFNIKEILVDTGMPSPGKPQNMFRMFISENYLYISILVDIEDVGDYADQIHTGNINFDDMPFSVQAYLKMALYYYDLSELVNVNSEATTIKMFPLTFSWVKQSCSFIKKKTLSTNSLFKKDSMYGITLDKYLTNFNKFQEGIDPHTIPQNNYQLVVLCGDAMSSGNFHSGIVLNRNLVAVHKICQLIDQYIDAYPKDKFGNLNNNFLRSMFFKGNIINQKARNEIIKKSVENLINYSALRDDKDGFNIQEIMASIYESFSCKNNSPNNTPINTSSDSSDRSLLTASIDSTNETLTESPIESPTGSPIESPSEVPDKSLEKTHICKNSVNFVEFMEHHQNDVTVQKLLRYLYSPEKYKFEETLRTFSRINRMNSTL